jgi:hypothetical protein
MHEVPGHYWLCEWLPQCGAEQACPHIAKTHLYHMKLLLRTHTSTVQQSMPDTHLSMQVWRARGAAGAWRQELL